MQRWIMGRQDPFGGRFEEVRQFLLRINEPRRTSAHFLWARWEWAMSLYRAYGGSIEHNALWYDGETPVALATNESLPGKAYCILAPGYDALADEILDYAIPAFAQDGKTRLLLPCGDSALRRAAAARGYHASQERETTSAVDLCGDLSYVLPDGFSIRRLADGYDLKKLRRCTYRGFHPGAEEVPDTEPAPTEDYQGPHFDKRYHTVVIAPNGDYAGYCGVWYDRTTDYAYVEPVCTDPLYRRRGVGRAAVFAALRRAAEDGARTGYVVSGQPFYYRLGFYPVRTDIWWER